MLWKNNQHIKKRTNFNSLDLVEVFVKSLDAVVLLVACIVLAVDVGCEGVKEPAGDWFWLAAASFFSWIDFLIVLIAASRWDVFL